MLEKRYSLTPAAKQKIVGRLREILSNHPEVIFAYLHGSFLLAVPCRDVDLALYLKENSPELESPWKYEARLAMEMDPLLHLPVDAHLLNQAPVTMRYQATRGKLLFSRDELARFTFLEQAWDEYFDYEPCLRQFYDDIASP